MRHLAFVIISRLALGFIAAWLVSWLCVLTVNASESRYEVRGGVGDSSGAWSAHYWNPPGAAQAFSLRTRAPQVEDTVHGQHPETLLPSWSSALQPTREFTQGEQAIEQQLDQAFGWPRLALHTSMHRFDVSAPWVIPHGLLAPQAAENGLPRVYPLRPLWAGLVVNTLVYAAVIQFVLWAPGGLRRAIRAEAGCCPKCGRRLREASEGICPGCDQTSNTDVSAA